MKGGSGRWPRSWSRPWRLAIAGHFVASIVGFWLVAIVALGVADSRAGVAPAWLGPTTGVVNFGLLQPVAHWIFEVVAIRYWTWLGLAVSTLVLAVNSLVAIFIGHEIARVARRKADRRR